ncbi:hypothetical protein LIER_35764 [Lithospermum erythrorhizon]|uniref:Uncharacterized protein n=1 Tax=Lithospermum erythrorhizon TaxID=34254 RepID=A0AAV3NVW9_LITER
MGLENGLTAGITKIRRADEGPTILSFDADTCPLIKAPKNASYCRQQIETYTTAQGTGEDNQPEVQVRVVDGKIQKKNNDDVPHILESEDRNTNGEGEDNQPEFQVSVVDDEIQEKKNDDVPHMSKSEHGNINGEGVNTNGEGLVEDCDATLLCGSEDKERTLTQEMILMYPQFLGDDKPTNTEFDEANYTKKNDDDDGSKDKERTLTQEMILLYPQFLGVEKPANTEFDEANCTKKNNDDDGSQDKERTLTQEMILLYPQFLGVEKPANTE